MIVLSFIPFKYLMNKHFFAIEALLRSRSDLTLPMSQFGRSMMTMLCTVNHVDVSAPNNVEWDAVDIVPHVFKFWWVARTCAGGSWEA